MIQTRISACEGTKKKKPCIAPHQDEEEVGALALQSARAQGREQLLHVGPDQGQAALPLLREKRQRLRSAAQRRRTARTHPRQTRPDRKTTHRSHNSFIHSKCVTARKCARGEDHGEHQDNRGSGSNNSNNETANNDKSCGK